MSGYESEELLHQYLLFHYGTADEISPPAGVAAEALEFSIRTAELDASNAKSRALDLGCAVGRSTFELSKRYDEVIGIDFSQSFIDAAALLATGKTISYRRHDEANLAADLTAAAPADARPDRIAFQQSDAMNLPPEFGTFDLVHAANLLCRLPKPLQLLTRLPDLVAPGGSLLLATPCTWLEEHTPKENWPPGTTLDFIEANLAGSFALKSVTELPFLIREHSRKFQLSTSQTSLWSRT